MARKKRQNPYGEEGEEIIGCGSEIISFTGTSDYANVPDWLIPDVFWEKRFPKKKQMGFISNRTLDSLK